MPWRWLLAAAGGGASLGVCCSVDAADAETSCSGRRNMSQLTQKSSWSRLRTRIVLHLHSSTCLCPSVPGVTHTALLVVLMQRSSAWVAETHASPHTDLLQIPAAHQDCIASGKGAVPAENLELQHMLLLNVLRCKPGMEASAMLGRLLSPQIIS